MAAGTTGSEFGLMHINMAGNASLLRARELQFLVTTDAARRLVLPLQRETGRCMIKGPVAAHLPGVCRVTCLAWQLELPVRRSLSQAGMGIDDEDQHQHRSWHSHFALW